MSKPVNLLDERTIRQCLMALEQPYTLRIASKIDSTNRTVKAMDFDASHLLICLAEQQTKGRGRFGRDWYSPFAENIYCSVRLRYYGNPSLLSGLSIALSLGMSDWLGQLDRRLIPTIKWPNDLLIDGKKVCGSLIEAMHAPSGATDLIIGLGLNVNMHQAALSNEWTSLGKVTNSCWCRSQLAGHLVLVIEKTLTLFFNNGLDAFMPLWPDYDYLFNKPLLLQHQHSIIQGVGQGIDNKGHLLVRLTSGELGCFSSGDTSLHKETGIDSNSGVSGT